MPNFSELALGYGANRFSYSKLKIGEKCAFRFNKTYIDREKPTNKVDEARARIGVIAHSILENTLNQLNKKTSTEFDIVKEEVVNQCIEAERTFEMTDHEVAELAHMYESFQEVVYRINAFAKQRSCLIFTEIKLAIKNDFSEEDYDEPTAFFRGIIDLVLVDPHGNVAIVDHKSGFPNKKGHLNQLKTYNILALYALGPRLMREHNIQIKDIRTGLNFIGQDRVQWEETLSRAQVETQVRSWFISWVNGISDDIATNKIKRGKHCNECRYRSYCGSRVGLRKKAKKNQNVLL